MNSCGNHSISIAKQSSAQQCWSVLAYCVPISHPSDKSSGLKSGNLNISKVILKSESQFNYLFSVHFEKCTLKFK